MILTKEGINVTLSVRNHQELDKGTLGSLIRASGLSVDEFNRSLLLRDWP